MALLTHIILLGLLNLALGEFEDCVINNLSIQRRWERQLRKDLKCNYNFFESPKLSNSEPLTVYFEYILTCFGFSSDEEKLTLNGYMLVSWTDERLKWDPEKYGGVTETELFTHYIWTPGIKLYNGADPRDFDKYFFTRCSLKHTGYLLCVPRVIHEVMCSVKLRNFPYDVQNCDLGFGPWDPKKEIYNFNFSSQALNIHKGAEYSSQWFISDYRQKSLLRSNRPLNITLVLEREALSLAAIILSPCLILSGLTLVCLFLDVRHNVRLGLVCFSIFGHYYWLSELGAAIPRESLDPPLILLFYRGSLVLTVLTILVTFILDVMCKKNTVPHNIVISINGFVYDSYARFVLFPRWDIDGVVMTDEDKFNEDWSKFANCINSLCAFAVVISYIGLYFAYMPQPPPVSFK